ncbi:uncharacterized protein N7484_001625 [Penicillium longicatenatum]|uniref:uncharacterized protein n=1 Tax=Penicillium longicatenatum TaxID=1561947 RepID=UPI0025479904|nr:uncharacterized protein N7484_001625 [Penicillium longicatenatum]KAJ5657976.1 hypothetical protein N7484_001625 [Penicillium longicatenatum]
MSEVKNAVEEYPLSRDYVDFNRLNLQHYILKDMFGYSLHPKIPRTQKSLKIADVGTGTGIWLLDLLSQLNPSTELVGIDIDITQVGPREWLPDNLTLRQWNVFTDVPDDLVGAFDIVHLRHFAFVIEEDTTPILQKLKKLLKPGGYLQWCEVDVPSFRINTASPSVSTNGLVELWEQTMPKETRLFPKWVKMLPESFRNEGFLDVTTDWHDQRGHIGIAMHWCNLPIHEMLADRPRSSKTEKSSMIAMMETASVESRKGAMYAFDRVVVVGQKP